MRWQQIFSDDTEIAPGTGRKKNRRSGTETGPFRSPRSSYRMRFLVGTTRFFRVEPLCRLEQTRRHSKVAPGARASGEPVRHQFALVIRTMFSIGQAKERTRLRRVPYDTGPAPAERRNRNRCLAERP